jgi:chitin disaccharide deacetylase
VASLKLLIVNADDFGSSRGVNRGIVETHERGIVTSASLMVYGAAAGEAAAYGQARPELGVGLHVDLRSWRAQRRPWSPVRSAEKLRASVVRELRDQLEEFQRLLGRNPSHIDTHHHRHRAEPLRSIFAELARELEIPLRHVTPAIRFCGDFYGHDGRGQSRPEAILPDALMELLGRLPTGVTELGCHPGYTDGLDAWYREERVQEIRSLCDARVRAAVERLGIRLVSFADIERLR